MPAKAGARDSARSHGRQEVGPPAEEIGATALPTAQVVCASRFNAIVREVSKQSRLEFRLIPPAVAAEIDSSAIFSQCQLAAGFEL
ncbi:hypothetical protein GGQ85_000187 [Nitrobacter vulgaris]|nr:hypothetical protein [Nitrobacter vulgaris]